LKGRENMKLSRKLALTLRVAAVLALGAALVPILSTPAQALPDPTTTLVLAATLFAHEPEAFREHGSAGLYDHGGPLAASMSTISPG